MFDGEFDCGAKSSDPAAVQLIQRWWWVNSFCEQIIWVAAQQKEVYIKQEAESVDK